MKKQGIALWQKIFFLLLPLTVLAVFLATQAALRINFRETISGEIERSRWEHSFSCTGVQNKLSYEKSTSGNPFLGKEGIGRALARMTSEQTVNSAQGLAVYRNKSCIAFSNTPFELRSGPLLEDLERKPLASQECRVVVRNEKGLYYTVSASLLPIENESYELFTVREITSVYQNQARAVRTVEIFLFFFTLIAALFFYFALQLLLSPLRYVNSGIQEIAGGNYSLRLSPKGSAEFRSLSRNINRMARSVEENIEQVQSLADSRKRFIDNLAHEMKTPLTSILGFADLLRVKRSVSEKQRREFAGVIVEEAKRLQSLSGKLMELIFAESAKPDCREIPLEELFREISLSVSPLLARRGVRLLVNCPGGSLWADRELLKSCLYNLIDNAAKASKEGEEIEFSCSFLSDSVLFSVSDWGMGMDEKTVRRAAEPFYMADKSRSRKNGGAGLGLALCARIAELHGGSLRIKSKLHEGTTVFLSLPKDRPFREEGESISSGRKEGANEEAS